MVHPCGRFGNTDIKSSFFIRISPLACAFDAIISIFYVVEYMVRNGAGVQEASYAWRKTRFPDEEDLDTETTTVELSPIWRFITAALAIAQGVKLLACTGAPMTQTFAAMYIGSFLVLDFILRLGSTVDDSQDPNLIPQVANRENRSTILYFSSGNTGYSLR
jgi:hypothetical protein